MHLRTLKSLLHLIFTTPKEFGIIIIVILTMSKPRFREGKFIQVIINDEAGSWNPDPSFPASRVQSCPAHLESGIGLPLLMFILTLWIN